jgi:hypothetical protein
MPSRAEIRGSVETALRAVSLAIIAWMLWLSLDRARPETVVSAGSSNLELAARDWSTSGIAPDRIALHLDSTPSPVQRDWLGALLGAGSNVTWSGDLPVIGVGVQPIASPRRGFTILAAAPAASSVRVDDDAGALDTAVAKKGGARFAIPSASGMIRVQVGGSTATSILPDSARIRRVLVIGSAGWESKFVVAALEEDGWKVDAEMKVSSVVSVTQGVSSPLDTSRYSAVVVLDGSAAPRASAIARYAASGGGVILAGTSGALDAFSAIRAGAPGKTEQGSVLSAEPGGISLASLSLSPLASLRSDAIPLDSRNGQVAAAARREGSGRILQHGYVDTWRWRMGGGDSAPDAHREWWTRAVASVAYAPHSARSVPREADDAPVAHLIAALGASSPSRSNTLATVASSVSLWLLFVLRASSLLAEWISRRLRGEP